MKAQLFAILLAASVLRIAFLGAEGFWLDEALSVYAADRPALQVISYIAQYDFNPPLYFLLLHFWGSLFGFSEISSRLLSVFFGIALVAAVYLLAREISGNKPAVIASLMVAVSPFYVSISQEARMYSLHAFLAVLSFFLLVLLVKRFSWAFLLSYAAATVLLLYSHVYAIFIVAAQLIWLALKKKTLYPCIPVVFFIPWILVLLDRFRAYGSSQWLVFPSLSAFAGLVWLAGGVVIMALLLFSVAFARPSRLLFAWASVPVLLSALISLVAPVFFFRYFSGVFPAVVILGSVGISRLGKAGNFILFFIVVFSLSAVAFHYYSTENQQWREAAHFVDSHSSEGDRIYFMPGYSQPAFDFYSNANLTGIQLSNSSVSNVSLSAPFWLLVVEGSNRSLLEELSSKFTSTNYSFAFIDVYRFG